LTRTLTLLLLALATAACSSPAPGGKTRPGCAPGTVVPGTWKLNFSRGLSLVDSPFAREPATGLGGTLFLQGRDGGPAPDPSAAVVTVNGADVPRELSAFVFGSLATRPAGVEPGGTVRVVATLGGECTSVAVTCPSFTIASPAEGSGVVPGGTVAVSWQGVLHHPSPVLGPAVGIDTYSAAANERSASLGYPVTAPIAPGDASAILAVPPDTQGGYLVELGAPGPAVLDPVTEDSGICLVARRVHLTVR